MVRPPKRPLTSSLLALIVSAGCAGTHTQVAVDHDVDALAAMVDASNESVSQVAPEEQAAPEISLVEHVAPPEPETLAPIPDQEALPDSLTLAHIEQLAMANNPTISQLNAAVNKGSGLRYQVGLSPNPTVGYQGMQLADRQTDQHVAFVEQEFVRGDKLALNRAVLDQATRAQMWELEAQRFRVLTDVRMRYFEAIAAQRQLDATKEFLKVADQGVKVAERRKMAGEASQVEVLQSRILMSQVELAAQQIEARYLGAWKDLVAVAGVPHMSPTRLDGDLSSEGLDVDWDSKYHEILSQSPELAAAQRRVSQARAMLCRQEAQPIPNITMQLGAGFDQATDHGMLNLQFGAPIPVFNDNSGNISAAYADFCRATHEVKRIEMAIKSRLARAAQEYDSALAAVRKYEGQILPDAQNTLDLSEQSYEAGQLDFLQVLIVRKTFFDARIQSIQAQGDLAQAQSKIDGLLLTGGLDATVELMEDDGLRGQSFGGQ